MLILTFLDAGLPRVHRLRDGDNVIGRAPVCELVITAPEMSRQHARVRVTRTKVILEDLGSSCGTFVDGTRITGAHPLHPGDSFKVATVEITLASDVNEIELNEEGHLLIDDANSIVVRSSPPRCPSRVRPAPPRTAATRAIAALTAIAAPRSIGAYATSAGPQAIGDQDATGAAAASSGC